MKKPLATCGPMSANGSATSASFSASVAVNHSQQMPVMRIALVLEATTGGTARHVVDLASELIRRHHEVTLVYSPIRADTRFEAEVAALAFTQVVQLPMRRAVGPWDIVASWALRQIFNRLGRLCQTKRLARL